MYSTVSPRRALMIQICEACPFKQWNSKKYSVILKYSTIWNKRTVLLSIQWWALGYNRRLSSFLRNMMVYKSSALRSVQYYILCSRSTPFMCVPRSSSYPSVILFPGILFLCALLALNPLFWVLPEHPFRQSCLNTLLVSPLKFLGPQNCGILNLKFVEQWTSSL